MEHEKQAPEEVLIHEIYSSSLNLLEKYGKRFYKADGIEVTVNSFFCDTKDERGSSDINFSTDATDGFNSKVSISFTRIKNNRETTRAIVADNFKIERLVVTEKEAGKPFRLLYSGDFDKGKLDLDSLRRQVEEAEVNLEAQVKNRPCQENKPIFMALGPRLRKFFDNTKK